MNPKVDQFLENVAKWRDELEQLRMIALDCKLTEELKWRQPCYTFQKKNIIILASLKDYCAISFLKGSLLNDPHDLLEKPGENSQSVRLIKFTATNEIVEKEPLLRAYINNAIEVEKAGLKVDFKEKRALEFPKELHDKLAKDPAFKKAFESLTLGRQRGYNLYFSAPKNSETKISRIEAYEERILKGYGFHDCVCGQSQRFPRCDGSHKYL